MLVRAVDVECRPPVLQTQLLLCKIIPALCRTAADVKCFSYFSWIETKKKGHSLAFSLILLIRLW